MNSAWRAGRLLGFHSPRTGVKSREYNDSAEIWAMKWETVWQVTPVILAASLAVAQPAFAQIIQGDVALVGGSLPPKPVTIERICSGVRHTEGVTDGKGHFNFELGQLSGRTADASVADPGGPA